MLEESEMCAENTKSMRIGSQVLIFQVTRTAKAEWRVNGASAIMACIGGETSGEQL